MSESKLVPEGYFPAVAVQTVDENGNGAIARFALSKEKKTRHVVAYFQPLDYPGQRLRWTGFFTKETAKRTCESLRYMGFKGDDLGDLVTQPLDQIVDIKVEHDSWTNEKGELRTYARVAFVNKPGGGVVKLAHPMSDEEVSQFAAMMRDSVARLPEEEGERHSTGGDESAPPPDDEWLPTAGSEGEQQSLSTGGPDDDIPF